MAEDGVTFCLDCVFLLGGLGGMTADAVGRDAEGAPPFPVTFGTPAEILITPLSFLLYKP